MIVTIAVRKVGTPACSRCLVLLRENEALRLEVAALRTENARLREKLGEDSHNSSKAPSGDPASKRRHPMRRSSGRKPGGQHGHIGARRALTDVPSRVHEIHPKRCAKCGSHDLKPTDSPVRRRQVAEIPAAPGTVDEYRQHEDVCVRCHDRSWGKLPADVPAGCFGPRLLATIAYMTGTLRMSRRATVQAIADMFGLHVSLGSITAIEKVVTDVLAEPVKEAHRAACAQPVADVDETGWRQRNRKAWLWVLCTSVATVFQVAKGRGYAAFRKLTRGFHGILVSDRWVVYGSWDLLKRQLCWSHLERTWVKFVERGGPSAAIGEALLEETHRMFHWWHKVRDGTMTRESFRHHMSPLSTRVYALLERGARLRSNLKTQGQCDRIRQLGPALWTFVEVEGVEPTNNIAEHRIRTGVQWRRVSLGTQSAAGSRYVERVLTATATLRQHGRNVYQYFVEAMRRRAHGIPAPSLLTEIRGERRVHQAA
jgi:transposase